MSRVSGPRQQHGTRGPLRARSLPRWWPLPVCALLGAAAGGAYGVVQTPEYSATSYVVVTPAEKADPSVALGFAQAYGRVATEVAVIGDAQVWAGVSAATLRAGVQTATSPDAPMIAITASSSRAADAAAMANAVARALTVNGAHSQKDTGVRVVQFSRAAKPLTPSSPSAALTALVGGCAGGLLGGLALLTRPRRRAGTENEFVAAVPGPAGAASVPQEVG
ncbi:lipopolysaccharide biosynthesis protein [Streptomyces sp. NBC_00083]|uniref:lipopolysaccharide biosynthesis protein n=1 Tax=Streptomyces sp. NBC_00083 TaxID=2975647 RepID=UPI00225B7823|nr:lipopolysaccharide biosynthesis protein [Streptomyces sp. NBC_00083]MCX5381763.1 lipopolysaccharide biosynthesis protein [Streptomyces sp. NBC_00083]